MNAICILMDSLNRHFLPAYGNGTTLTPNLERLRRRAVTFDSCFIGSMPCMPARRDLWTGNQEFLWRPWGSLEPWDAPLARTLKSAGVFTGLVTDHYHLWETGGENYHTDFESCDFIRGHENDNWAGGPTPATETGKGWTTPRFARNRLRFAREEDWLAPRTFSSAAGWLEENGRAHDRFFLMVDEFDPHEPFDCPEAHWRRYDPGWDGPDHFFWPRYGRNDFTEAEIRHIRARYAGKVTLADRYLGRVLDRMDDLDLWKDTAVFVMTDHGHFLGEHGWWGKPGCPQYRAISHTPLLAYVPGAEAGSRARAVTTHVDVHATILDWMGCAPPAPVDGVSLLPVLRHERESVRDGVLFGWFGDRVNWTDGRRLYLRAPAAPDNQPLCLYTDRWSTAPWWRLPKPDDRTSFGRFMPRAGMPVCRHPLSPEEMLRVSNINFENYRVGNLLFDIEKDPDETTNLAGGKDERECSARMKDLMDRQTAPPEQYDRLGL